jgi:hypothetical protein
MSTLDDGVHYAVADKYGCIGDRLYSQGGAESVVLKHDESVPSCAPHSVVILRSQRVVEKLQKERDDLQTKLDGAVEALVNLRWMLGAGSSFEMPVDACKQAWQIAESAIKAAKRA